MALSDHRGYMSSAAALYSGTAPKMSIKNKQWTLKCENVYLPR